MSFGPIFLLGWGVYTPPHLMRAAAMKSLSLDVDRYKSKEKRLVFDTRVLPHDPSVYASWLLDRSFSLLALRWVFPECY
jgi:hypothetical protein